MVSILLFCIHKLSYRSDSDSDEVYDEIDKFHQEQDNEILKDLNKRKSRSGTEEVLGVYESDSELTDSSEDSVVEDDGKNRDKDCKCGILFTCILFE